MEMINVPFFFFLQFNFVGRILGPRGMTAKQLEQETGCKIMVRGKGSMRDKKKVSEKLYIKDPCVSSFYSLRKIHINRLSCSLEKNDIHLDLPF